jgi:hypothetical protein
MSKSAPVISLSSKVSSVKLSEQHPERELIIRDLAGIGNELNWREDTFAGYELPHRSRE